MLSFALQIIKSEWQWQTQIKSYGTIKNQTGRFIYSHGRPKSVHKRCSNEGCHLLLFTMSAVSFTFKNAARETNDDTDCQYHKTVNVDFSAGEQQIFESAITVADKIKW